MLDELTTKMVNGWLSRSLELIIKWEEIGVYSPSKSIKHSTSLHKNNMVVSILILQVIHICTSINNIIQN